MVWRVCLCGLHFCNPQAVGRVVGGMGYIFVTRKQMGEVIVRGVGSV